MRSVVVVEPEVPGNTGFIARLAANFEYSLRLVDPCFNLEEARETAANAQQKLRDARIYRNLEEAVDDLDYVVGTKPGRGVPVEQFPARENTSVVIGCESSGLGESELELCDSVVHISTPGYSSMNQSHAAAVVMHSFSGAEEQGMTGPQAEKLRDFTDGMTRELLLRSNPAREEARKLLGELSSRVQD